MKTILLLTLAFVLAFGWLPAAAQGEAPVDAPEPGTVVEQAGVDNSEPYPLELVSQVFLPALGTDHDGVNAMAPSAIDAGTVTAANAFTTDARYNERDYFYTGQVVKYIGIAGNTTGAARTATLQWRLDGPCGAGVMWSGVKTVAAGANQWWILDRVIPNCLGDYVFTFKVTYAGVTTSYTSNFSVVNRFDGGMQLSNVRVTTPGGQIITSVNYKAPVLWRLDITNNTDKTEVVTVSYYRSGVHGAPLVATQQFTSTAHTKATFDYKTTFRVPGVFIIRAKTSFGDQGESQSVYVYLGG